MSVSQRLEHLLKSSKKDETIDKFQEQYITMLHEGVIQRKGYNLASIDVVGQNTPSPKMIELAANATLFIKPNGLI